MASWMEGSTSAAVSLFQERGRSRVTTTATAVIREVNVAANTDSTQVGQV